MRAKNHVAIVSNLARQTQYPLNIEDAVLNISLGTNFTHPERLYQN